MLLDSGLCVAADHADQGLFERLVAVRTARRLVEPAVRSQVVHHVSEFARHQRAVLALQELVAPARLLVVLISLAEGFLARLSERPVDCSSQQAGLLDKSSPAHGHNWGVLRI